MNPLEWDAPFWVVALGLFVIVMFRSNATYWLGRLAARGARQTRIARHMDSPGYHRAVERINRWGAPIVTVSFLTIGVQTLVLLAAGATAMPQRRFLPACIVGSIAWALVYAALGFVGVEAFGRLWERSPALTLGILAVVVVGVVVSVAARRRRSSAGAVEAGVTE